MAPTTTRQRQLVIICAVLVLIAVLLRSLQSPLVKPQNPLSHSDDSKRPASAGSSSSAPSTSSSLFAWLFDSATPASSGYDEKEDAELDDAAEDLDLFIERHKQQLHLLADALAAATSASTSSSKEMDPLDVIQKIAALHRGAKSSLSVAGSAAAARPSASRTELVRRCRRMCDPFWRAPLNETVECSHAMPLCLGVLAEPSDIADGSAAGKQRMLNQMLADVARQMLSAREKAAAADAVSNSKKSHEERCDAWLKEQCVTRNPVTGKDKLHYHARAGACIVVKASTTSYSVELLRQSLTPEMMESSAPALVQEAFAQPAVREALLSAMTSLKVQSRSAAAAAAAGSSWSTLLLLDLEKFPCQAPPDTWACPECVNAHRAGETPLRFSRQVIFEHEEASLRRRYRAGESSDKTNTVFNAEERALLSVLVNGTSDILLPPLMLLSTGDKHSPNLRTRALYQSLRSAVDRRGRCGHVAWHHRAPSAGVFCGTEFEPLAPLPHHIRHHLGFNMPPAVVLSHTAEEAGGARTWEGGGVDEDALTKRLFESNESTVEALQQLNEVPFASRRSSDASGTFSIQSRFFATGGINSPGARGAAVRGDAEPDESEQSIPVLAFGKSRPAGAGGRASFHDEFERLLHRSQQTGMNRAEMTIEQRMLAELSIPPDWCDPLFLCAHEADDAVADRLLRRAEPWNALSGFSLSKSKIAVFAADSWYASQGMDAVPVAAGGAAPVLVTSHLWFRRRPERHMLAMRMRSLVDLLGAPWQTHIPWLLSDWPASALDELSPQEEEIAEKRRIREEAGQGGVLDRARRIVLQARQRAMEHEQRTQHRRHERRSFVQELMEAGQAFERMLRAKRLDHALETVARNHREVVRALRRGSSVQAHYLAGVVLLSMLRDAAAV